MSALEEYVDVTSEMLDRRDVAKMTDEAEEQYAERLDDIWVRMTDEERTEAGRLLAQKVKA